MHKSFAFLKNPKDNSKNNIIFLDIDGVIQPYSQDSRFEHELEKLPNYFAEKYGVLGYMESSNFINADHHTVFLDDINEEIRRNSKAPFVKNFRNNYEGGELPIFALVEVFSFGTLSKFYKNMTNSDKKVVAKSFNIGYTYLESWLESISHVRNICAHYGRLYNAKLSKTPILYKEYSQAGIGNNRIFGVLLCLKHILKNDPHWNDFVDEIDVLVKKYKNVDIKTMGFPSNWKQLLKNTCRNGQYWLA